MQVTYTFADLGAVQAAFIQEMNTTGNKVGLACNLASNVSSSSLTVNCVRADSNGGWSAGQSLLVSLFH